MSEEEKTRPRDNSKSLAFVSLVLNGAIIGRRRCPSTCVASTGERSVDDRPFVDVTNRRGRHNQKQRAFFEVKK